MTVADLLDKIQRRLDDASTSGTPATSGVYYTSNEAYCALNEAQAQFAFLTLCLETTGTITLSATKCFYGIRGYLPGYLAPLRVTVGGVKLQPARLADLDARNHTWPALAGTPTKYVQAGFNLMAITPQPAGASSATVTYAKEPVSLSVSTQIPEIPVEYHHALAKYATYYLMQKRGGQYLAQAIADWDEFLAAASACATYVRQRNRARQYDTIPAEFRLPVKKQGNTING